MSQEQTNNLTEKVDVRIDTETRTALESMAKKRGTKAAQLGRQAILEFIEREQPQPGKDAA